MFCFSVSFASLQLVVRACSTNRSLKVIAKVAKRCVLKSLNKRDNDLTAKLAARNSRRKKVSQSPQNYGLLYWILCSILDARFTIVLRASVSDLWICDVIAVNHWFVRSFIGVKEINHSYDLNIWFLQTTNGFPIFYLHLCDVYVFLHF